MLKERRASISAEGVHSPTLFQAPAVPDSSKITAVARSDQIAISVLSLFHFFLLLSMRLWEACRSAPLNPHSGVGTQTTNFRVLIY